MSRLKDRLKRLKPDSPQHQESTDEHTAENAAAWEPLGGEILSNSSGSFVRRVIRYPLHSKHGYYELGSLLEEAEALSALHADQEMASIDSLLFFDTETTGLGIGAGNVPFMLGFGYFEYDAFVVEQCLMRNPGDEPARLEHFQDTLRRFTFLVTYNGRTFDWPVLKNRYVLNRMAIDDNHVHHIDFLYPSRSLWKHILPSCSLGQVEEARLGVIREDDVPGSMAPALYFQYLSTGDAMLLHGVLLHNESDVLSLAGLAAHFAGVLRGRVRFDDMAAEEVFRLGLWFEKLGKRQLAHHAFDHLLRRPEAAIRRQWLPLATVLKKSGRIQDAVRLWKAAAQTRSLQTSTEPFIELAKYYEHKTKQFDEALQCAAQARSIELNRLSLARRDPKARELLDALDKRLYRLRGKLAASRGESDPALQLFAGDLFGSSTM